VGGFTYLEPRCRTVCDCAWLYIVYSRGTEVLLYVVASGLFFIRIIHQAYAGLMVHQGLCVCLQDGSPVLSQVLCVGARQAHLFICVLHKLHIRFLYHSSLPLASGRHQALFKIQAVASIILVTLCVWVCVCACVCGLFVLKERARWMHALC